MFHASALTSLIVSQLATSQDTTLTAFPFPLADAKYSKELPGRIKPISGPAASHGNLLREKMHHGCAECD